MEGMKAKVIKPGEFKVGTKVVIHGLAKKPELNGEEGTVTGECSEDNRQQVKLSNGTSIKVKIGNLKVAKEPSPEEQERARTQMERLPIYFDFKSNLKFAADCSNAGDDRCAVLKTLHGHAQSGEATHHEKLVDAGFHKVMLGIIANPTASQPLEEEPAIVDITEEDGPTEPPKPEAPPKTKVEADEPLEVTLRLGAIANLQTFCQRPDNVKAVVAAGAIDVLLPLLSRPKRLIKPSSADSEGEPLSEQSSDPRFAAVDTIGTMSNHHEGKLAIGKSPECMRSLVRICKADDASGILQEGAMHTLGQLIFNQECWQPLIDAGALGAAVAMLRESKTTQGGAARAVGMLYLNVMTGFAGKVRDEPGAMEVLHQCVQGRHGPEALSNAQKALQMLVEKAQKAGAAKDDVD